jgi:hypothetical protein
MNGISLFTASVIICAFACDLSADTPQIRVTIHVFNETGDNAQIVSALSREFRKLDGVSVTDKQPALTIVCDVTPSEVVTPSQKIPVGYAAAVAVLNANDQLVAIMAQTHGTIDGLAHEIAIKIDGTTIEPMRRKAQPTNSP